jgi:hypothetical protein
MIEINMPVTGIITCIEVRKNFLSKTLAASEYESPKPVANSVFIVKKAP